MGCGGSVSVVEFWSEVYSTFGHGADSFDFVVGRRQLAYPSVPRLCLPVFVYYL